MPGASARVAVSAVAVPRRAVPAAVTGSRVVSVQVESAVSAVSGMPMAGVMPAQPAQQEHQHRECSRQQEDQIVPVKPLSVHLRRLTSWNAGEIPWLRVGATGTGTIHPAAGARLLR